MDRNREGNCSVHSFQTCGHYVLQYVTYTKEDEELFSVLQCHISISSSMTML